MVEPNVRVASSQKLAVFDQDVRCVFREDEAMPKALGRGVPTFGIEQVPHAPADGGQQRMEKRRRREKAQGRARRWVGRRNVKW
jgi:hypothetical protein